MIRRVGLALSLVLFLAVPAGAVTPGEMLADPALESRARALSAELRCMVCQNQSIDDSDAPLAHDLRVLLRERIVAGDSDAEVIEFLVARYGEFILLRPRFDWNTALLWGTPAAALAAGAITVFLLMRRRRGAPTQPVISLSEAEQRRIADLTGESRK